MIKVELAFTTVAEAAAFFVAATFASIGLPGFANFWGELTIFVALWKFSPLITVLALAGVVISAIYGLRSAARIFFGQPATHFNEIAAQYPVKDLTWTEKAPALVLLVALLWVGFWPKSLSTAIDTALQPAAQTAARN